MSIRCKFRCSSVRTFEGSETVEFTAVDGEANKPWSQFTPYGKLEVNITNPDARGRFEPGKSYLLDISPSE